MKSEYAVVDKRAYKRVQTNFLVVYKVREPWQVIIAVGNREIIAIMSDLGEGGMAILTNYDIPPATVILSRFTLVNSYITGNNRVRTMETIGDVVYNVPLEKGEHRLGVSFTQIANEDRSAIGDLVRMTP